MFRSGGRCLGIDIGDKAIKLAQLKGSEGKLQVSAWSLLEKDRPNIAGEKWRADMFEDIKLALQVNGLKGGKASVALPDSLVNISYRKVPPMPGNEVTNALKWEAGKDWKYPVEEMAMDYISLGEVMEGTDTMDAYLVAISRKSLVEDLCTRLSQMRIKVRSIEFSTMAQMSCLLRSGDTTGTTAMVDLAEQFTNLLFIKDGRARFFRTINTGGSQITEMISQATGLSWWEADKLKETGIKSEGGGDEEVARALRGTLEGIVDEVYQTFHFYGAECREGGVDRVVITGGGGQMPGVSVFFQEILGIPTDIINPFEVCVPSGNLRDRDRLVRRGSRMATAFGLAMTE